MYCFIKQKIKTNEICMYRENRICMIITRKTKICPMLYVRSAMWNKLSIKQLNINANTPNDN